MSEYPHGREIEGKKRKQQSQQTRQLLSCVKCRERKVKCDRTKPCSACCARGQPKECHFVAEGGDYTPIQQSYELRKLRAENLRLKERLRSCNLPIEDDDSDLDASPDSHTSDRPTSAQRRRITKQKRFQGAEWQDTIYFGSPGVASVVSDFAAVNSLQISASLAYLTPRGPQFYLTKIPTSHPFPTIFPATPEECVPKLLGLIPQRDELFKCLASFEKRVNLSSFPHVPLEINRSEVEQFLADAERNASACPDMLALLFAAMALGGQHSVWDHSGGQWQANVIVEESKKGEVYIAAAMQALRLASFMHKPSLLSIQALIMMGPYLTNSGRYLDAWTLFGTTIRLAHSVGLHRHPKFLDPQPATQRECFVRQTLWWWMLHMDEQYSMTLGRPLGISGIGDCPPPQELSTDPHILRFGEFVNHFTILGRQILGSDRLTNAKIDEYTDEVQRLLDTMPELLQFNSNWVHDGSSIPEWPLSAMAAVYFCKAHTYMILLNRQRQEASSLQPSLPTTRSPSSRFRPVNRASSSQSSPGTSIATLLRGRPLVIRSSEHVLDAFLFFYKKIPAALVSWSIAQQAFNSCMLLLLDALERRQTTCGVDQVDRALAIFTALQDVHKLAPLAIQTISLGLQRLNNALKEHKEAPQSGTMQGQEAEKQGMKSEAASPSHRMFEESVMGANGMFIVDNPGLQGSANEAFAPLQWNAMSPESRTPTSQELKRPLTKEEKDHNMESLERRFSHEPPRRDRSAELLQEARRSRTVRTTPVSDTASPKTSTQPPTLMAPKSQTGSAESVPQQHITRIPAPQTVYQNQHPPHLEHTSLYVGSQAGTSQQALIKASHPQQMQNIGHYPAFNTQMRHNSCPSIPQLANHGSMISSMAFPDSHAREHQRSGVPGIESLGLSNASDEVSFASFMENITSASHFQDQQPGLSWNSYARDWPEASNPNSPPESSRSVDPTQRVAYAFSQQLAGEPGQCMTPPRQHVSEDEMRRWFSNARNI